MSGTPKVTPTATIIPHLWFVDNAVEAASFYVLAVSRQKSPRGRFQ